MGFDPSCVNTITFDSFSTLADVDSTASAVEGYVDNPVAFAREWHTRAVTYGMVANYIEDYETYYDLHRDALEYLLTVEGITVSDDVLDEMTAIYHEMDLFDDVRDGLACLADAGYNLGIISNGNPPMLESLVQTADIGDFFSVIISADEIECYKPAIELYEYAAGQLNTDPDTIVHISNGQFDIQGAMNAGMQGIWLNRQDVPLDPFGPDPDHTISSIDELLTLLP